MGDPRRPAPDGRNSGSPAKFDGLMQEVGRRFILTFGYLSAGIVSALIGSFGRIIYSDLVEGAESRATIGADEKLAHALHFGLTTTMIILILSLPVAWLPLSVSLAALRHLQFRPLAACFSAGCFTGSLLAVWVLFIASRLLHQSGDLERIPSWLVLAHALPIALPAGGAGGFVLWALCYRGGEARL